MQAALGPGAAAGPAGGTHERNLDLLVVGAHPDDAEVHVGGILALAARNGLRAAILDLTSGDLGTRGTAATRQAEAMAAAGHPGGAADHPGPARRPLRRGRGQPHEVMAQFRALRPGVLILPAPEDRHPDHRRAFRLVPGGRLLRGAAELPLPGRALAAPGGGLGGRREPRGARTWWWT